MATMPPLALYDSIYIAPYDPDNAIEWYKSIMNATAPSPPPEPVPPCPVTHIGCTSELVGSSLVCGYVKNDIDYLFYCPNHRRDALVAQLDKDGWKSDGKYGDTPFESWRKGKFNLILTDNYTWYKKFVAAATLCKVLGCYNKQHRIAVHKAMLKDYEEDE